MERVQKFISSAGVASRRKAEEFIKSGQVTINGKKAKLGDKMDPFKDEVKVYGKTVKPAEEKIYVVINKPKGFIVSKKDPRGRKTAFSLLPEDIRDKVWNIGRLDADTEGLLLMTNDGELTQQLSHPRFEHEKEYEVVTSADFTEGQLEQLRQGVEISTGLTYPAQVKVRDGKIRITIHEGKKRQVRRMFAKLDLPVKNLKRIRIGKYVMPANLNPGSFRIIKKDEIL